MMGGVFPRQGWERRFFLQILCILCGKTLPPKQEPAFFFDLVAMEVELPRTVPPEMGFNFDGVSEWVEAGEVLFFDGNGACLLSTVHGTVIHLSREG